jgi:hypothetical protein
MADADLDDFYNEIDLIVAADGDDEPAGGTVNPTSETGEPIAAGEPSVFTEALEAHPAHLSTALISSAAPTTTIPAKKSGSFAPRALSTKVISKPAVISKPYQPDVTEYGMGVTATGSSGASFVSPPMVAMYIPTAFGGSAGGTGGAASSSAAYAAASAAPPLHYHATPAATPSSATAAAAAPLAGQKRKAAANYTRTCAGEVWVDETLADWPESECGCGRTGEACC